MTAKVYLRVFNKSPFARLGLWSKLARAILDTAFWRLDRGFLLFHKRLWRGGLLNRVGRVGQSEWEGRS